MGKETGISWTDFTWNIARGCRKVDSDCKFCYMYRDSFDGARYNPREVVKTKTVFTLPLKYKETKSKCWEGNPLCFTSSLTDAFLPEIDSYRDEMWDIIDKCRHITFQILTKRPERIVENPNLLPWRKGKPWDHVWIGTSVGSPEGIGRLRHLTNINAKTRFLSAEPLHRGLDISEYVKQLDWVIVGGESGHETGAYRYRPCELGWIEKIVGDCQEAKVPVFVKQLGTQLSKDLSLSDRHGSVLEDFPAHLQLRQFPALPKAA